MNPEPEFAAPPRSQDTPAPKKVRYTGIDIIKILALIFVVTVHSFLHTGFYSTPMSFDFGLFQVFFRWAAFCCVPLFMTVTGYLMSRKKLTPGFYGGILRVLVIYLIASIINMIFNIFGNILMFVPTGIILPILYKRLDNFFKVAGTGFLMSLAIEIMQLPFAARTSDVDDLIMNTLGVATGFVIYITVRYAKQLGKQKVSLSSDIRHK